MGAYPPRPYPADLKNIKRAPPCKAADSRPDSPLQRCLSSGLSKRSIHHPSFDCAASLCSSPILNQGVARHMRTYTSAEKEVQVQKALIFIASGQGSITPTTRWSVSRASPSIRGFIRARARVVHPIPQPTGSSRSRRHNRQYRWLRYLHPSRFWSITTERR